MEASARARFGVRSASALKYDESATNIDHNSGAERFSLYTGFINANSIGIKTF